MSQNVNRSKLKKAKTSKEYNSIQYNDLYPLYWDEGINYYPRYNRGTKSPCRKQRQLQSFERRMYRSWKCNRKTRWK
jgi:hypothetical protein